MEIASELEGGDSTGVQEEVPLLVYLVHCAVPEGVAGGGGAGYQGLGGNTRLAPESCLLLRGSSRISRSSCREVQSLASWE